MDVDFRSPRVMQGVAAGVVLLGFVADIRFVSLVAALGLLATFVLIDRPQRNTWIAEIGLLAVSTLLFLVGRAGWAWVLASLAGGIAALASAADVWILPDR